MTAQQKRIQLFDLVRYGLLALPLAAVSLPLYINAPDFYIGEVGLSLTVVGAIMLLTRIFDAIQDPIIGYLSQKYAAYRAYFMYAAIFLMMISFFVLFHPVPDYPILSLILSVVLLATCFSVLSINLNSMGSLWGTTQKNKLRITTFRECFTFLGLLMAILLPFYLGYQIMTFIIWFFLFLSAIFLYQWNHKFSGLIQERENISPLTVLDLKFFLRNKLLQWFVSVYFLSMVASAIPAVLIIFFVRDYLQGEQYIGLFLLLYFIAGGAAMFAWQRLANHVGMGCAWLSSMVLAILTFSGAVFLSPGDIIFYALICFLSGLAFSAEMTIPPAMLSTILEKEKQNHLTAVQFSIFAFLLKFSLAIGTGLAFFILDMGGFTPAQDNSAEALKTVLYAYTLLPIAIKITAAILISFWWITHRKNRQSEQDRRYDFFAKPTGLPS